MKVISLVSALGLVGRYFARFSVCVEIVRKLDLFYFRVLLTALRSYSFFTRQKKKKEDATVGRSSFKL